MTKTAIQKAIEDLKFMKSKSVDAFSDIVWGMAVSIIELHLEDEKQMMQEMFEAGYDFRSSKIPSIIDEFGDDSYPDFETLYSTYNK